MIFFVTIFLVLNYILAFEPSCSSCKFYIPSNTNNPELGFCRMFKNTCYHKGAQVLLPNYAQHCRENEHLCGKTGVLYEANADITKESNKKFDQEDKDIIDDFNEINNRCCGEVNENHEIEQLEKDFFDILQRIKKHNKKKIYNTSKDLYKLFKRDK
jgi:hypothetical protein